MRISILMACLWLATSPLYAQIVFLSLRAGNWEIYKMDIDGGNQIRLSPQGLAPKRWGEIKTNRLRD